VVKTIILNDTKTGRSFHQELSADLLKQLQEYSLDDMIDGSIMELAGCRFQITGAQDQAGRPLYRMANRIKGSLLSVGAGKRTFGLRTKKRGLRRRRFLLGPRLTANLSQVSMRLVEGDGTVLATRFEKQ